MKISIIAAVSCDGVIGKNGDIPWPRLRRDLGHFQSLTRGHIVIAGRKTHESILHRNGHPLKGRTTVIMTRNPDYRAPGCMIAASLEAAIDFARERSETEVFIIGGGDVYWLAIHRADRMYLTIVNVFVRDGDAHFPLYPEEAWTKTGEEFHPSDRDNPLDCTFRTLERRGLSHRKENL